MKKAKDTLYRLRKRIVELERANSKLQDDLYAYRTTTHEIFDGATSAGGDGVSRNWILQRLKRCLR